MAGNALRYVIFLFAIVLNMASAQAAENPAVKSMEKYLEFAEYGGGITLPEQIPSEEVRELYTKVPAARMMPSTESFIWIALSTLCRIGELLNARWAEVDFQRGVWTIPAENKKNGKPHTIYLSGFALLHFRALHESL